MGIYNAGEEWTFERKNDLVNVVIRIDDEDGLSIDRVFTEDEWISIITAMGMNGDAIDNVLAKRLYTGFDPMSMQCYCGECGTDVFIPVVGKSLEVAATLMKRATCPKCASTNIMVKL